MCFSKEFGEPHQTISDLCRIVQDSYIASKCTLSSYCVYGLDSRRASLLRDSSRVKLMDPPSPTVVCAWLIQPPPSLLGIGPLLPLCWTRPCTSPVPLWPTLETWICRARWFFFGEEISNDWGIYWDYWHLFWVFGIAPFLERTRKMHRWKDPLAAFHGCREGARPTSFEGRWPGKGCQHHAQLPWMGTGAKKFNGHF